MQPTVRRGLPILHAADGSLSTLCVGRYRDPMVVGCASWWRWGGHIARLAQRQPQRWIAHVALWQENMVDENQQARTCTWEREPIADYTGAIGS